MIAHIGTIVVNRLRRAFGYDATQDRGRRKAPSVLLRSEDAELTPTERRKLVASGRDIRRNYAIAGWCIRKHLDYVSTFNFQSKSGFKDFDAAVEARIRQRSKAANCDVAGRHSLPRIIRMLEAARVVDGDVGILRLADGRVQVIEGDRIRTPDGGYGSLPPNVSRADFIHGVQCDEAGKAIAYSICRRGKLSDFNSQAGTFRFERLIPARNLWLHGYFDRFDQVRGVSPLAAGLNTMRDLYENSEYALARMKISQLFGLVLKRKDSDGLPKTTDADGNVVFDFGKGPQLLDLSDTDAAEFLESSNPSTQFQDFHTNNVAVALKSLDIPYSFYDESHTNFSGQRQAWIQYDLSARIKRLSNIELLDDWTAWQIGLDAIAGDIELPEGLDLSVPFWRWNPLGVPWVDPLKEVQADVAALAAGLTSRMRILKEQGQDIEEVADELQAEAKLFKDRGLEINAKPSDVTITEVTPADAA